jgi:methionine-S-sulfoxide reductase
MVGRDLQTATFAGGCFWCMQPPFDSIDGVVATMVGYTGGDTPDPTYKQVCSGTTGHTEAMQVTFDPTKVSYVALLEEFWRNIDPTTANGQFCDLGTQYRTAIFYHDDEQRRLAEESKQAIEASGRLPAAIMTEIVPATAFYVAEEDHQGYYLKNPVHSEMYSRGSGRKRRLAEIWRDDD